MKFRKKPVVIEAVQLPTDPNYAGGWPGWLFESEDLKQVQKGFEIETPEGVMLARRGDWIIRGVSGEIYPCKPDIFEKTYEEVG